MGYRETLAADRRLVILKLLARSPAYTSNEHTLHAALPAFGHDVGLDLVRAELAWLDEQGLLSTDSPAGVALARATQRGLDVAAGRSQHPGVKRPPPGE